MSDDLDISLSELETVVSQLNDIISEFEEATSRSEELEAAIDSPFGQGRLRDQAQDFEERWDDKRDQLKSGLEGVRDHVQGVVDGVRQWDTETAIQLAPPT